MKISSLITLSGLSTASAFGPKLRPQLVPVRVPGNAAPTEKASSRETGRIYHPRSLQPVKVPKTPLVRTAPALQEYIPTTFKSGNHKGLTAYSRAFPDIPQQFTLASDNTHSANDPFAQFWLERLDFLFQASPDTAKQRELLDKHLIKEVNLRHIDPMKVCLADNLKGVELEQSIEYLRLAMLALEHAFIIEEPVEFETYKQDYRFLGDAAAEPTIKLSSTIADHLKQKGIKPVEVLLTIDNVLSARNGRLLNRSLMSSVNNNGKGITAV